MALPVTLSGIYTLTNVCGPFKSSSGNFYFFHRDLGTGTILDAQKATDPTSSWSQNADTVTVTDFILAISGYQVGDTIHLFLGMGVKNSADYSYVSFDMSSDTFGTETSILTGLSVGGDSAAGEVGGSIVVRSDGDIVVVFQGEDQKDMGTDYAQIYYAVSTNGGTSFGTATQVTSETDNLDHFLPDAVLGTSDRTHMWWLDGTNAHSNTLNSSDSLGTERTASASVSDGLTAISYNDSGTQRIRALLNAFIVLGYDSADDPASISTIRSTQIGTSSTFPNRLFYNSSTLYALYRNNSLSDIYAVDSSNNGTDWGTPVETLAGAVGGSRHNLSVDGAVYTRGGRNVIPYVVNDNGTWKYNEYELPFVPDRFYQLQTNVGVFRSR